MKVWKIPAEFTACGEGQIYALEANARRGLKEELRDGFDLEPYTSEAPPWSTTGAGSTDESKFITDFKPYMSHDVVNAPTPPKLMAWPKYLNENLTGYVLGEIDSSREIRTRNAGERRETVIRQPYSMPPGLTVIGQDIWGLVRSRFERKDYGALMRMIRVLRRDIGMMHDDDKAQEADASPHLAMYNYITDRVIAEGHLRYWPVESSGWGRSDFSSSSDAHSHFWYVAQHWSAMLTSRFAIHQSSSIQTPNGATLEQTDSIYCGPVGSQETPCAFRELQQRVIDPRVVWEKHVWAETVRAMLAEIDTHEELWLAKSDAWRRAAMELRRSSMATGAGMAVPRDPEVFVGGFHSVERHVIQELDRQVRDIMSGLKNGQTEKFEASIDAIQAINEIALSNERLRQRLAGQFAAYSMVRRSNHCLTSMPCGSVNFGPGGLWRIGPNALRWDREALYSPLDFVVGDVAQQGYPQGRINAGCMSALMVALYLRAASLGTGKIYPTPHDSYVCRVDSDRDRPAYSEEGQWSGEQPLHITLQLFAVGIEDSYRRILEGAMRETDELRRGDHVGKM